ncbi:hypothetical protein RclHR1_20890002 [Rhizophagus clarus]|uniref:P-loop containing nucleoside triphosphate hydrolase protein n=1 Tax=Rhizophagus clarus TaxID=94130 RepID=A0A2Z6RKS1_9GLOM|nr:hypothetical protein RclHR1_20890002 [Rhizophagus clarus]GES99355.1 P-loop containing nucleoside triphosphate hydrolase protein [Rhizophagus clarus]
MATISPEIPDVKELKEISNDEIIKELKKKGSSAKNLNVIHVTKPFSEKYAGSSESSSDKKHSIVISEEGALCFKSYDVWLITYESTSEGIINITTKKYFEDKKIYSKEIALAKAIDIKFELKNGVETVYVSNEVSEKPKGTKPDKNEITYLSVNYKDTKDKETENEDDFKNILLVGRTGDGKSAIANVLVDSVGKDGMPYFEESACGISKTKKAKMVPFNHEGKKYRIIDTIGIGDTKLSFGKVLEEIIKAIHNVNYRLNHIFFVTRGRMTREELDTFNLLKTVIFCDKDKDNGEFLFERYTTLVRSGFGEFEDPNECQRDIDLMMGESVEINELITMSCRGGPPIYVDNPPVYIELDHELAEAREMRDDKKVEELEKKLNGLKKEREISFKKRKHSRKILLKGLEKSEKEKVENHQNDYYEAKNIRELGEKIIPLMKRIKMLKEILEENKKNNDGNDKTTRELKKSYKKMEKELKKLVLKEIKNYADEREKVTVIKTDDDEEDTNDQFTTTVETTLISIGGILVNAFVPGLGSELSQIVIGLIKPKNDQETCA